MAGTSKRLACLSLLCLGTFACGVTSQVFADDLNGTALTEHIAKHIRLLSHSNYRVRESASWELSKYPTEALPIIASELLAQDYDTCSELVDYLTEVALGADIELGIEALEILNAISGQMTSAGKLASNAVYAISELQEEEAIEILRYRKAVLGPRGTGFNLNASTSMGSELALRITNDFQGNDEDIQRIRFLKSVETIYFQGEKVDSRFFDAIRGLRGIRNVKIRNVKLTLSDLTALQNLDNLELLELNYVDLDDTCIPVLASLPISQSMRLYGTKITQEGAARLREDLDGLEIYCGRGGFLGVATAGGNVVTQIVQGSAAEYKLAVGDRLLAINDQEISNFDELREELGKFVIDDKITVRFQRKKDVQEIEVELTADPP